MLSFVGLLQQPTVHFRSPVHFLCMKETILTNNTLDNKELRTYYDQQQSQQAEQTLLILMQFLCHIHFLHTQNILINNLQLKWISVCQFLRDKRRERYNDK